MTLPYGPDKKEKKLSASVHLPLLLGHNCDVNCCLVLLPQRLLHHVGLYSRTVSRNNPFIATTERQAACNGHSLDLFCTAALNAWDRIGEMGKKIESFTKVMQGPKEAFVDFLQRLTSAGNRMLPNSETRQIIIESLDFENANSLCKKTVKGKVSTFGGMDLRYN